MSFQLSTFNFPLRSAFLALPLEGEAQTRFKNLQSSLEPWKDILRFQNPETPHLTLQFWRELMQIEYGPVGEAAKRIAERTTSFTLESTVIETFGDKKGDRVLYLAVHFSPELATVKKLCPWPSDRPFHPHITIACIDHPQRFVTVKKKVLRALGEAVFSIAFQRLTLFAEIDGKKQTPVEEFAFEK